MFPTACTMAAIISALGYMPPPETVIAVPRSKVAQMTVAQQVKAKACALKYKIRWTIDENL